MAENDKPEDTQRRRLNLFTFESTVDKQIREAMERGDFDNLKGTGKPQNLMRDPNVPEDWELAFNLLKNAGYAPDWIETLNHVRKEQEKILEPLNRYLEAPPATEEQRARKRHEIVEQFRQKANALNREIDTFNLKAPTPQVHIRRIRIDHEIETFLSKAK